MRLQSLLRAGGLLPALFFAHLLFAQTPFHWITDRKDPAFGGVKVPVSVLAADSEAFLFMSTQPKGPLMAVLYSKNDGWLTMKPAFLPDPDVTYHAYLVVSGDTLTSSHQFIWPDAPTLKVELLPNVDTVPANLLRVYLLFNQPMGFANPYDYVTLSANGEVISEPWVDVRDDLWNTDRTRFTLLIHPGRIKQGVGPGMALGPVLKPGDSVSFVLKKNWSSQLNNHLNVPFESNWVTAPAVRTPIKDMSVHASAIKPNTKDSLVIKTDRLLDPILLAKLTWIESEIGARIPGEWKFMGKTLLFYPEEPWKSQVIHWVFHQNMEDVCGNRVYRPFDWSGEYPEGDQEFSIKL